MHYLFLLILGLIPSVAIAGDIFKPSSDDLSIKILDQIFGGLHNTGLDQFGEVMMIFNVACLSIGGILAAYTIISGTINTAHDGEIMGKKGGGHWLAIRYGIGTALLLPILPGGYCVIQGLVMWCIVQGVGLADQIWTGFNKKPQVGISLQYANTAKMSILKVAEDAYLASVCVAARKRALDEASKDSDVLQLKEKYDFRMLVDADGRTFYFGDQKSTLSFLGKSDCGYVQLPKKIESQTVQTGAASNGTGVLGSLDNIFKPADLSELDASHVMQTAKLVLKMKDLAERTVKNNTTVGKDAKKYYKEILDASNDYMKNIEKTAKSIVAKKGTTESADGKQYGWILAGASFNSVITNSNKIASFMNAFPNSASSINLDDDRAFAQEAATYMIGNQVLSGKGVQFSSEPGSKPSLQANEQKFKNDNSTGAKFTAKLTEIITTVNLYELKNDMRHPVIILNDMGNRFLSAFAVMAIAVPTLAITTGWIPLVGTAITSFISIAMTFLFLPLTTLVAVGFMLAWVLPFIPFMIWLGCVFGYFIQVIIAIFAAPIWCLMHLHPNGDDLTGKGGNGYTLLMGLLLRPALLVIGFIGAMIVSSVGGEFINKVFFQIFSYSQSEGNGVLGMLSIIAGGLIYSIVMFTFLKKCFGIIHIIPDEILQWVGGGSGSMGSYASTIKDGAQSGFAAIGTVISGIGQSAKPGEGKGKSSEKLAPKNPGGDNPSAKLGEDGADVGGKPEPQLSPKAQAEKDTYDTKEAVHSKLDGQSGVLSEGAINDSRSALDNAMKRSGLGKDDMMKDIKSKMDDKPDVPVINHINEAYSKQLSEKFGHGSGVIAATIGGGFHTDRTNDIVDTYKEKHGELSAHVGSAQATRLMGEMNRNVAKNFKNDPESVKNGGTKKLSSYLSDGFKKLQDDNFKF